ncbi:hypothetical protein [Labilibacter marinus]|uniref:hypothetical protein n=1 Tax=Labilibacter marinus TaxID=1477105 RepID=UPI00373FE0A5
MKEVGFKGLFPNTLVFDVDVVLVGIICIIIFNVIFFVSYIIITRINKTKVISNTKYNSKDFTFLLVLSMIILVLFKDKYLEFILQEAFNNDSSLANLLIIKKVLFMMPFAATIYFIVIFKEEKGFRNLALIFVAGILLVVFKNPLVEKRNALGPIYLTVLFFLLPGLYRTNLKSFGFMLISMVILFPLATILTHRREGDVFSQQFSFQEDITEVFSTLHYDAFSNFIASIDYMYNEGISYGYQFLGGLFFFIPRSIWTNKPLSGGKEIGKYLIDNFSMWFDNVSMPYIGEAIMNFGYLGLLIFPILLAFFIVYFEKWSDSGDFLKKMVAVYFSFHLLFLLRGDFTNGFAYFIGPMLAMYVIPKALSAFRRFKISI